MHITVPAPNVEHLPLQRYHNLSYYKGMGGILHWLLYLWSFQFHRAFYTEEQQSQFVFKYPDYDLLSWVQLGAFLLNILSPIVSGDDQRIHLSIGLQLLEHAYHLIQASPSMVSIHGVQLTHLSELDFSLIALKYVMHIGQDFHIFAQEFLYHLWLAIIKIANV